jgi:hypothetical protein
VSCHLDPPRQFDETTSNQNKAKKKKVQTIPTFLSSSSNPLSATEPPSRLFLEDIA